VEDPAPDPDPGSARRMSAPTPDEERQRRIENLRAVMAGATRTPRAPSGSPAGASRPAGSNRRRGLIGTIAAGAALLLGKFKFLGLLFTALKFKTLATLLLSIGIYATQWGWKFATGFVLLILVHELGHAFQLRREGIPSGAPVFIPFLGAFIAMRGMPRNAFIEAKVAIAGPVAGSLAAWAVLAYGLSTRHPLFISLGHVALLLNLFNLIPVSPLDGGRIAGAFTHAFWVVGYVVGIGALLLTRSPLLLIVLVVGLFTLWQRWRNPIPGYHDIPRGQRLAIGLGYAALVIAIVLTLPLGSELLARAPSSIPH
jgi:Zn-dependent protease